MRPFYISFDIIASLQAKQWLWFFKMSIHVLFLVHILGYIPYPWDQNSSTLLSPFKGMKDKIELIVHHFFWIQILLDTILVRKESTL